jgi:hypothetical protein
MEKTIIDSGLRTHQFQAYSRPRACSSSSFDRPPSISRPCMIGLRPCLVCADAPNARSAGTV